MASPDETLINAWYKKDQVALKRANQAGADPNATSTEHNDSGNPALRIAAMANINEMEESIEVDRLVLSTGADPNVLYEQFGTAPLHPTAGAPRVTWLLLSAGAGADPKIHVDNEETHAFSRGLYLCPHESGELWRYNAFPTGASMSRQDFLASS